jgi:hypothetical protein
MATIRRYALQRITANRCHTSIWEHDPDVQALLGGGE